MTTRAVAEAFAGTGMEYFNTFGGNPVSCAVADAVLRVVEGEGLRQNAAHAGAYLSARLRELAREHEAVGDVRGLGLFLGCELVTDRDARAPDAALARYLAERLREHGVLVSTDGPRHNVLKIKPPLVFGEAEADRLVEEMARALR